MPSARLAALAAVFIAATACAHAAPGAIISLAERQSATVVPGATLTYDSVEDSRCPPDVQCVVAGKVVYHFTLKQGDTLEHFALTPAAPDYTSPMLGGKRIALAAAPPPKTATPAPHAVSVRVVAP
jgi:uncharacterized cupredoxin-like copper-binding protein